MRFTFLNGALTAYAFLCVGCLAVPVKRIKHLAVPPFLYNNEICKLNCDTNGDGKADLNIDTDGDGKAEIKNHEMVISTVNMGTADYSIQLVMVTLLIMTPTVFIVLERVFDWGDRLTAKVRGKRKKKK